MLYKPRAESGASAANRLIARRDCEQSLSGAELRAAISVVRRDSQMEAHHRSEFARRRVAAVLERVQDAAPVSERAILSELELAFYPVDLDLEAYDRFGELRAELHRQQPAPRTSLRCFVYRDHSIEQAGHPRGVVDYPHL